MSGINKVILVGNLGNDPEVKYLPIGTCICNITVATSETWKDKNTGEKQEKTEWHRVVFFGRLAEIAWEYLRKGSKVYLEGSLETQKWQDKDGNDRYKTQIKAKELQMLDSKGIGQQQAPQQQQGQAPRQQPQPTANNGYQQARNNPDQYRDDIPF